MLQDSESKSIIRTVKQQLKSLETGDSLGKLIDTYFEAQEIEKKQNAEVSTPWKLRQEKVGAKIFDIFKKQKNKKKY